MTITPRSSAPSAGAAASTSYATVGVILASIVVLFLGQGIFVPLVLATLVAFALGPVVSALRRLHLPQVLAVLVAVLLVALLLGLAGYLITTQLLNLATDLPSYQQTIAQKLRALQQSAEGGGTFDRLAAAIEQLGNQVGVSGDAGGASGAQPLPVIVTNTPQVPLAGLQSVLGSLLGPLATVAIVTIFVIFLLLQREDLRDRFLKLVSRGDLRTSTKVINESAARVSRYLLVQFCVNCVYGLVFGLGLMFIGVPNAVLWGLFAALFRYIPFVGTLIAACIPIMLAFAVDPGWSMLFGVVGIYLAIELVTTNVIEPRLYGSSTGISPLAVLIAAMFWASLWGPIGLILSTPLTVCLVVLGRYVPQLGFLETILGSEPVLAPEQRLYQRLLAGNTEEAVELAETQIKEADAASFYDRVALPALQLAEADLQQDATDLGHRRTVVETMAAVVRDVQEFRHPNAVAAEVGPIDTARVLVIGGKTELDGAVADLIAHAFAEKGMVATVLPPMSVRREGLGQIDLTDVDVVCLCYLGADPKTYVRYAARRLKLRKGNLHLLACLFNTSLGDDSLQPADLSVDAVVRTISGAETAALSWLKPPGAADEETPEDQEAGALRRLRSLTRQGGWIDDFLGHVATEFNMPLAFATVIDPEHPAAESESSASSPGMGANTSDPMAEQVSAAGKVVVIPHVSDHELYSKSPFLLENGIEFYAGAPLLSTSGKPIGALSVVDSGARDFTPEDEARLAIMATELMAEFDKRLLQPNGTKTAALVEQVSR